MSITDTSQIDAVAMNSDEAVLVITDHLEWDGHSDDEHMYQLQEKVNTYLRFYESEEIFEKFPNARGKKVIIEVGAKYPLNKTGNWFFNQIKPIVESVGLDLKFKLFDPNEKD